MGKPQDDANMKVSAVGTRYAAHPLSRLTRTSEKHAHASNTTTDNQIGLGESSYTIRMDDVFCDVFVRVAFTKLCK